MPYPYANAASAGVSLIAAYCNAPDATTGEAIAKSNHPIQSRRCADRASADRPTAGLARTLCNIFLNGIAPRWLNGLYLPWQNVPKTIPRAQRRAPSLVQSGSDAK